ncbi:diguanylate cyclase [Halothiobacillus sp. DCM-1]|uniref:sensor domain-containing diguanylate cyclase n=1 Tax=Halothiobacillus sp. DCM-1 TaxID=3112558 RepID=UPI003243CD66
MVMLPNAPLDLVERLPAAVLVIAGRRFVYANPSALAFMQAENPSELIGREVFEFLHPLDAPRILARIRRAVSSTNRTNPPTEYRVYTCRGEMRVIGMTSTSYNYRGEAGLLACFIDLTERSQLETHLRATEEQFQRMMNTMQDVFYRTDAEGITRYVCPAVQQVLGYTAEEIIGKPAADFYPHPSDREQLKQAIMAQGFVRDFPGQMRRKDGQIIDISISSTILLDEEGKFAGVEGIWRDITERRNLERELERRATTDELTGIANRRTILETLGSAFERYQRKHRPLVVLILDLDFFKRINDDYGHVAGDRLLKAIVHAIQQEIRTIDHFGRLGGEEFIIVLEDTPRDSATAIAERILDRVRHTAFDLALAQPVHITLSIGATAALPTDRHPTHLLEHADAALYAAKEGGRDQLRWHTPPVSAVLA